MAVKSNFASGDVLTASDVNTYLTNGGLVYVAEGSGTNVATLDVNSVFSSTYDAYRLVIQLASRSASQYMRLQYRTSGAVTTTNYYSSSRWYNMISGNTLFQDYDSNTGAVVLGPSGDQSANHYTLQILDVLSPNLARATFANGSGNGPQRGIAYYGWINGGVQLDSTQFTGFRLVPNAGNFDYKYVVYGYRQA